MLKFLVLFVVAVAVAGGLLLLMYYIGEAEVLHWWMAFVLAAAWLGAIGVLVWLYDWADVD